MEARRASFAAWGCSMWWGRSLGMYTILVDASPWRLGAALVKWPPWLHFPGLKQICRVKIKPTAF